MCIRASHAHSEEYALCGVLAVSALTKSVCSTKPTQYINTTPPSVEERSASVRACVCHEADKRHANNNAHTTTPTKLAPYCTRCMEAYKLRCHQKYVLRRIFAVQVGVLVFE